MKNKLQLLQEEVYGNLATVYHRTSHDNLVNSIYTEGFKPGIGAMYGRGFYSTYSLKSQEKDNMSSTYGNTIIKFAVPTKGFFFFDYDEFKKSPLAKELKSTNKTFIADQSKYYKLKFKDNRSRMSIDEKTYSSDIAIWAVRSSDLISKVNGIIFTGRHDGKVLISYKPKTIIPMSFKTDGNSSFIRVEKNKQHFTVSTREKHREELKTNNLAKLPNKEKTEVKIVKFKDGKKLTNEKFLKMKDSLDNSLEKLYNVQFNQEEETSFTFKGLSKLKEIHFNPSSPFNNSNNLFKYCDNLTRVTLPAKSNQVDCEGMFSRCLKLKKIKNLEYLIPKKFDYTFANCWALKSLPSMDMSKVTDTHDSFLYCVNLTSLDMSNPKAWTFSTLLNKMKDDKEKDFIEEVVTIKFDDSPLDEPTKKELKRRNPGIEFKFKQ